MPSWDADAASRSRDHVSRPTCPVPAPQRSPLPRHRRPHNDRRRSPTPPTSHHRDHPASRRPTPPQFHDIRTPASRLTNNTSNPHPLLNSRSSSMPPIPHTTPPQSTTTPPIAIQLHHSSFTNYFNSSLASSSSTPSRNSPRPPHHGRLTHGTHPIVFTSHQRQLKPTPRAVIKMVTPAPLHTVTTFPTAHQRHTNDCTATTCTGTTSMYNAPSHHPPPPPPPPTPLTTCSNALHHPLPMQHHQQNHHQHPETTCKFPMTINFKKHSTQLKHVPTGSTPPGQHVNPSPTAIHLYKATDNSLTMRNKHTKRCSQTNHSTSLPNPWLEWAFRHLHSAPFFTTLTNNISFGGSN